MARRKKKTSARRPSTKRKSPARAKRRPAKRARRNPTPPLLLLPLTNPVITTKAGRRLKIDSRNKTRAARLLNARKAAKKAHKKKPDSWPQPGGKRLTYEEAMITIQRAGQTSRKRKAAKRKPSTRKAAPRKSTARKSGGGGSRAVGRDQLSVLTTLLRP